MNTVINAVVTVIILLSSHIALEKIQKEMRRAALVRIHQGMPSLTSFANRLTSKTVKMHSLKTHRCSKKNMNCSW